MAIIYIPKTAPEIFELTQHIIEKHRSASECSPLNHLEINGLANRLETLKVKYNEYQLLSARCEKIKQEFQMELGIHKTQRALESGTIRFNIVQVRDTLKGIAREDISALKKWGFKVIENGNKEE